MMRVMGALLLLCACTKPTSWTVDQIDSDQEAFRFSKLSYRSADPVHGIDVDVMQELGQVHVYLAVHSTPVPSLKDNAHAVAVSLQCQQEHVHCIAYRFQGGQRFQLPSESAEKIIEWLKSKQEITILLKGYRTLLTPEDFEQKYDTFLHPFPLRNPLQFLL